MIDRSKAILARKMRSSRDPQPGYDLERSSSPGERGYRRKKIAAMAGSLYRSGQAAVTEIKESYAQTRATRDMDGGYEGHGRIHIPGAFPDVAITVHGDEQMVLFPSYAKRHIKKDWSQEPMPQEANSYGAIKDEDYWRQEWERDEDEKAIVDVDVRGWIYCPHTGPMTRRNRMLIGLARQLSGIPTPRADQTYNASPGSLRTPLQMHEEMREQEKISQEAARIERQGQAEKKVANHGGYSERPQEASDTETEGVYGRKVGSGSQTPDSPPTSPTMSARNVSTNTTEMSEAELSLANANLMARIAPFMTNPRVALPITLFFYNETKSQSRTVITNDAGHFIMRAALDFIPTHVKVLANESLSAISEVLIIEPSGVSLISDIDDTIKQSNIASGAKEIFRNTFVRELNDLAIEGVKEWYNRMYELGVSIHYCSNSPWQLYPVLASYFKLAGLPPGSLHLKAYSGMLQGIFEPVAERKKSTLTRLLKDFPERRFLLVGDSGEADLEVYTELALTNPGRILAVFIRDVTTPVQAGFFDPTFDMSRRRDMNRAVNDDTRPSAGGNTIRKIPSSRTIPRKTSTGPAMGTLVDFSDEPENVKVDQRAALSQIRDQAAHRSVSTSDILTARKAPPPRPAKPIALRSAQSITDMKKGVAGTELSRDKSSTGLLPPPPRKMSGQTQDRPAAHPLSQMSNSSQQTLGSSSSNSVPKINVGDRPLPPPPRRRGTPSNNSTNSDARNPPLPPRPNASNLDIDYDPLPAPRSQPPTFGTTRSGSRSDGNTPTGSPTLGPQVVNKKLELWKRRLARAHEQLDDMGIALYTWRRGDDVIREAEGIVKRALRESQQKRRS